MKVIKPIVFRNYGFSRNSVATYYNGSGVLTEAGIDELRLGYNPTTLEYIGPIIESEGKNRLIHANDFGNAAWTKTGSISVTSEAGIIEPDGTSGAQYLSLSGLSGVAQQSIPSGENPGGAFCFSFYVKVRTFSLTPNVTHIQCGFSTASEFGFGSRFNLFYGSALPFAGTTAGIQALPNGWFRVWVSASLSAGQNIPVSITLGTQNNGAEFYVFGAQAEFVEAVGAPSSFIYTTGSTETRAPDIQSSPPSLVTSNVDENDHPDWDDEVTYAAGDQVIVRGDYHRVYEALAPSTNSFPPDNLEDWLDQGATNRWRMFDMEVGSEKQTVSNSINNSVEVLVDLNQQVNSVVLLNMDGTVVHVTMRNSEGNIVYTRTQSLMLPTESDWWSFFFGDRRRARTLVLTDLPPYRPSTVEMRLEGGNEPAKIGKMIVGHGVDIGCARYGTSVGILDFSRKERDPFGNNFVLERRYIDRAEFDIQMLTSQVDAVKELLAEVRATPVVYVGNEDYKSTVIFGFFRDFSIILSGPKRSDATMEVEGI